MKRNGDGRNECILQGAMCFEIGNALMGGKSCSFTFTHALTHSLTNSLTHPQSHNTAVVENSHTYCHIHTNTLATSHSLLTTHFFLTPSPPHSLTHSLTHSAA